MALNFIVASHGFYAQEALNAAKLIIGEAADKIHVISVTPAKTYSICLEELQDLYASFEDKESGVLILTDIYGGTPANISSILALNKPNIQIYSGFNLPVIIELCLSAPQSLDDACRVIESIYSESFVNVSEKLKEGAEDGDQVDSY